MGVDVCVGTCAQDCGGQDPEQLPFGIDGEFQEAQLRILAFGIGRQRRTLPAGAGASGVSNRGVHLWRSSRPGAKPGVAAGTGGGCDVLFETCGLGYGLWQTASLVPDIFEDASREI